MDITLIGLSIKCSQANNIDDFFEYSFFNLSKTEADVMNPAHRILLGSVYESVESS